MFRNDSGPERKLPRVANRKSAITGDLKGFVDAALRRRKVVAFSIGPRQIEDESRVARLLARGLFNQADAFLVILV